jgi:hypothetical protein
VLFSTSVWSCLVCARDQCPHEDGPILFDDEINIKEYDSCYIPMDDATRRAALINFTRDIEPLIFNVVPRICMSNGLWRNHKYIGKPCFDKKVKTWMIDQFDSSPRFKQYFQIQRMCVQYVLAYRRKKSLDRIGKFFKSKSYSSSVPYLLPLPRAE